jgi:hypothetical protein
MPNPQDKPESEKVAGAYETCVHNAIKLSCPYCKIDALRAEVENLKRSRSRTLPFNELSPAQIERLALLAEECAEVIQIVGKILRHGYYSTHPNDPDGENNREMLETELGHVECAVDLLETDDIDRGEIERSSTKKHKTVTVFLHHQ